MPILKRIHVNQHVIRANSKTGREDPPFTIKTSRANTKAHTVAILGPSSLMYSPSKPLSCGAKAWIETRARVVAQLDGYETVVD